MDEDDVWLLRKSKKSKVGRFLTCRASMDDFFRSSDWPIGMDNEQDLIEEIGMAKVSFILF